MTQSHPKMDNFVKVCGMYVQVVSHFKHHRNEEVFISYIIPNFINNEWTGIVK